MKKRMFAILLALCMMMSILPATALATEGDGTLQAQIDAASSGDTITLDQDYTESITIAEGQNITLDLNGHTLTNEAGKDTITVALDGTLTITGSGTVDNVSHQCAAIYNNGTTTLNGGSYTRSAEANNSKDDANGNSYYNILNHGVLTINAGVSVTSSGAFSSLIDNGYYNYKNSSNARVGYVDGTGQAAPSLTINGGTFFGGINTVKNDDNATLVINDGTFSNVTQAVVYNANKAEINGGTFQVNTEGDEDTDDLYAVFNCNYNSGVNVVNTEITNGTFNGAVYNTSVAVLSISGGTFTNTVTSVNSSNISISGGKFSEEINSDYLADTVTTATDEDGKTVVVDLTEADAVAKIGDTYYKTLSAAIAAAYDGETVTLLTDVDVTASYLRINKAITLDLNGKTIDIDNTTSQYGILIGASVTLKNGSIVDTSSKSVSSNISIYVNGSAALTTEDLTVSAYNPPAAGYYNYLIYVAGGGALTLNSGTELKELENETAVDHEHSYYGVVGAAVFGPYTTANYNENATATTKAVINQGVTITTSEYAVSTNGSYHPVDLTINGGALTSSESTGIYFPGYGTLTINGGEITGVTGIEIRAGELNMSGGTVTGTGSPTEITPNGNGTTSLGAGIAVAQHTTKLPITVNITGGSVNGYSALYESNPQNNPEDDIKKVNINISGGDFVASSTPVEGGEVPQAVYSENFTKFISGGNYSSSVSEYVTDDFTAELYSETKNEDAPYSYYKDVAAAREDAVYGDIITDLRMTEDDDNKTYYTVTLDYNDNASANEVYTVEAADGTATYVISSDVPTRSGYTFRNWSDGTNTYAAGDTVTVTADVRLIAQWTANPTATTYSITTPAVENGSVTVRPATAVSGQTVTITVTPDDGYELDTLTVTDANGSELALTGKGSGTYTFTMPASKVTVSATFKAAAHVCPSEKYTDVDTTQWYHEGIDYVLNNGLMVGTGTTTFSPNTATTRGMIVTILYRLEGEPAVTGGNAFDDVADGEWYTDAVNWAAANEIVNGYGDGSFGPTDAITREQMAAILYRYSAYKGYDVTARADLSGYTDAGEISSYAVEAMKWVNAEGLITGMTDTTLVPRGSAVRAQSATILMRFCENVAK